MAWNTRRARAAAGKPWVNGRARAEVVPPEQAAASPALLLDGSFCRLPALLSRRRPAPRQLAGLAWPRVHKAADRADAESRFGRHFPVAESRNFDKGTAAFASDALHAIHTCCSNEFCTSKYACVLCVLSSLSVCRTKERN